ncbi:AraC family transcriptional regulator [Fodinicola feengrottensis]|uniref:AraC family transcriptional regulator n=1 Tax=Fodinicola feengrottensis TaxID=435914 RepID=A0ABN2HGJ1_9ACTN
MTVPQRDASQRPLSTFQVLRSADVGAVETVASRVFSPHLIRPGRSAPLDARLHSADLGALRFIYLECGAAVTIDTRAPLDYYAVNLPLSGAARIRCGTADVAMTPTTASVFSPVEHVTMTWSGDLRQLCVKIDAKALQEHARRLTPRPLRPVRFEPRLAVTPASGDSWVEVVRLADQTLRLSPGGIVPAPVARQIEQMAMTTLLLRQPNSCSEQLLQPVPSASLTAVRRVAELIQDAPEREFTVADLAGQAGVSVRALQEGFRRHYGVTPTEYLTDVRLTRARTLIEQGEPAPVRVSEVAYQVGFVHLGRFAQAYRRRFGVTPSTALRMRNFPA